MYTDFSMNNNGISMKLILLLSFFTVLLTQHTIDSLLGSKNKTKEDIKNQTNLSLSLSFFFSTVLTEPVVIKNITAKNINQNILFLFFYFVQSDTKNKSIKGNKKSNKNFNTIFLHTLDFFCTKKIPAMERKKIAGWKNYFFLANDRVPIVEREISIE